MYYKRLISLGATGAESLEWHQDRQKAFGHMYDGKAVLHYNGMEFHFMLWAHLDDDNDREITRDEIEQRITLKQIKIGNKWYDTHWYCYFEDGAIWLHEEGWFQVDRESELSQLMEKVSWQKIKLSQEDLQKHGFKKIL